MFLLFVWEVNRVKSYSSSWQINMEWVFLQMRHDALQQFCLCLLFQRGLVSTRGEYSHLENEKKSSKKITYKDAWFRRKYYWRKRSYTSWLLKQDRTRDCSQCSPSGLLEIFWERFTWDGCAFFCNFSKIFFCCSWKLTLPLTHLVIRLKPWRDKESWGFTAERTGGRRVRRTIWVKIIENQGLRKSFAQYN